jgi:eukaryotic-like serine/threonine-protein kinase
MGSIKDTAGVADPLVGTPYDTLQLLGAGGMGQVLVAVERETGRKVAVKLIRRRYSHMPELVERFYAEAKAASQTGHSHIVEVLDFGKTLDDRPYMVMELLHGRNLHELLHAEGRLPQDRAVDICLQMCDALGAAHVRGVVHRDLKPANVFLCERDGTKDFVKLLDFGLAQLTDPGKIPEVPIRIYGTPEYMAPEMARPKRPTEAQADIYSLGVLLYQMVTGTVPFQHDDPKEIVNSHLHVVPEPPRDRTPDAEIALALQRAVLKAMRKRPERRFSSMEEMSRALWRIQLQITRRDAAL